MIMKKTPQHTAAQRVLPLSLLFISSVALAAGSHDQVDHNPMSHANMDHGTMNHSQMDHSSMGHDMMDHGAMVSQVGMPAPAAQANKTYHVTLSDDMAMQFTPALSIAQGDVVRFVVNNTGKQPHTFSIGSVKEQQAHRKMMANMTMAHHNSETTLTLAPGNTAEIGWHFMGEKFVEFTCHESGHAQAGMKRNTVLR
ncbi:hypothetical protein JCM19237_611 [Photobacterium aphoticum]|uniref:Copper-binding protein n=1 Tax=Photobacterium aphoticum TaxID=754436 RepID=A0A090QRL2_9GAMM|nr:hypothetical protein JCM19237_611 [Photobacterium aphoticum]